MSIPIQPSSNGHEDLGGMPRPSSAGSSARPPADGEMPVPAMGDPTARGEMPQPDSGRGAGPAGLMPMPGAPAGGPTELPRFADPAGGGRPAAFEPGVVEVQFRADVAPTLTAAPGPRRRRSRQPTGTSWTR